MAKVLTIYYSLKGETIAPGMKIVNLEKGNTAVAAEYIQKAAGGDLFEIETEKTYQKDHMKMIYEAQEEIQKDIRVAVKALPESWESYDTIFLGYPNWWNTLPMPVVSFAERLDFTGKRVFPFCTNEGSGLGGSVEKLRELCTGVVVEDGISIRGSQAASSQDILSNWVKRIL